MAPANSRTSTIPFDRRTLIVWGALLGSMSLVSGLLLLLEPNAGIATPGPVAAVVHTIADDHNLIAAETPLLNDKWRYVVIHHSGQESGNAQTLDRQHKAQGYSRGLAYHFVIGNGNGLDDGKLQVGFRWNGQHPGPHVSGGENDGLYNRLGISICLIGNGEQQAPTDKQMDRLVQLVNQLQKRFDLTANSVLLNHQIAPSSGPGVLFPAASFRHQLLGR